VSNQEWIAGFRFLLRSPRRKLPFVPALNLFLASVQNQPFSSFRQEFCRSWCARPPDLFSLTCKLDLYFVPRHTTSRNLQTTRIIGGQLSLPGFGVRYFKCYLHGRFATIHHLLALSGHSWVRHRLRLDSLCLLICSPNSKRACTDRQCLSKDSETA
jgi:hypothetical protein